MGQTCSSCRRRARHMLCYGYYEEDDGTEGDHTWKKWSSLNHKAASIERAYMPPSFTQIHDSSTSTDQSQRTLAAKKA
jgi:hypothetical protein